MSFHPLHLDLQLPSYLNRGDESYTTMPVIPSIFVTQTLMIVSTYVTKVPEKITVTDTYVMRYAHNSYAPTYTTVYYPVLSTVSPRRRNKWVSHGRRVRITSTNGQNFATTPSNYSRSTVKSTTNGQNFVTTTSNYSKSTVKSTTALPLVRSSIPTGSALSVHIRVKYYTLYPVKGYAEIIIEDYSPPVEKNSSLSFTTSSENTVTLPSVQNFTENSSAITLLDVATGASAIFYVSTPYPTEIIILSLSVTSFAILILGERFYLKKLEILNYF